MTRTRTATAADVPTASQFMATLQRADLVTCTRVGQWSHYRRNEDTIAALGQNVAQGV